MTTKIFKEPMKGREDIIRLLLLLFYNNNTFNINYASIELLAQELFVESKVLESLQQLIIITEKEEQNKYEETVKIYKEIRLLTETSEVWINTNYESPNFQYNSVLLYFIDRLRETLKLLIKDFREERWTPFDCLSGL